MEPWTHKSQNDKFSKLNKKYLKNLVSMLCLKKTASQLFTKTLLKKANKKEKMQKDFYFCQFQTHKHLNLAKCILAIALFTSWNLKLWKKIHQSTEARWKKLHLSFTTCTNKRRINSPTNKTVHAECLEQIKTLVFNQSLLQFFNLFFIFTSYF